LGKGEEEEDEEEGELGNIINSHMIRVVSVAYTDFM